MKNLKENFLNCRKILILTIFLSLASLIVYKILKTIRLDPENIKIIDLWYWILIGVIASIFGIKKIFILRKTRLSKIFMSFIVILSINILTIAAFLISPHYLAKAVMSGSFTSNEEKYFYQKLKEFKNSGKKSGLLKDLTNFEWETFEVKTPYSPSEEIGYIMFYKNENLIKVIKAYQKIFQASLANDRDSYIQFYQSDPKNISKKKFSDIEFAVEFKEIKYSDNYQLKIHTLLLY